MRKRKSKRKFKWKRKRTSKKEQRKLKEVKRNRIEGDKRENGLNVFFLFFFYSSSIFCPFFVLFLFYFIIMFLSCFMFIFLTYKSRTHIVYRQHGSGAHTAPAQSLKYHTSVHSMHNSVLQCIIVCYSLYYVKPLPPPSFSPSLLSSSLSLSFSPSLLSSSLSPHI